MLNTGWSLVGCVVFKQTCRDLPTCRKKKNASYVSEGFQQLIPWKTSQITAGRCKYLFLPAVGRGKSSLEITPTATKLFAKGDGIIFKEPGFHKIFFPASRWDKSSFLRKPKNGLTVVLGPVELPCLDTAAWYFASRSFIDVSVKRGISRLFLLSVFSGLSAGLLSTRCPRKRAP